MRFRRRWVVSLVLLTGTAALHLSQPTLKRFEFAEPHMCARFRIVLYAGDRNSATKASKAAFQRVAQLDDSMSDYDSKSELMRLAARAGTGPIRISEDLFRVLAQSQRLARKTGGAFDVTIGPLVRLWRTARRRKQMPDPGTLARARELVGYEMLRLDPKARTAKLLMPGMQLDLGAIAKGYAADEALAVLIQHGMARALVDAGGDVVFGLPPPQSHGWKIGIAPLGPLDSPGPGGSPSVRNLILSGAAVATSGDAEQFVEFDGKRYSHVVDPRTGLGVLGPSGVTVVASSGTLADSLATAVSVLGPEQGMELIQSVKGAGVLIIQVSDDGLRTFERNFPPPAVEVPSPR